MRKILLNFILINPASIIVLGILNGIIPVVMYPDTSLLLHVLYAFAVTLPFFLISLKILAKFAIFSLLGSILAWNAMTAGGGSYLKSLPNKNCGAFIEVRISDFTATGKGVDWLPVPAMMKADVLRMRFSPYDQWRNVSGSTLLKFPRNTFGIGFGDVLLLEAVFEEPEPPIFRGGFDFETYLKSQGISRFFSVSGSSKPLSDISEGLWIKSAKVIIDVRDYLMNGMSDGMELKYKKMLAAIFFGCRQGLNYEDRQQFMQSGVMHIFAISGLHVGMLALTLYMIFCWVPFRVRHLLIPVFLLIYVLTTGLQASAMRAFLMIGIWSLHRAALKSVSPLNTIFLAAVLVLIWNPLNFMNAGFQYSFVIAGFLVLSWQSVKKWFACLNEKNLWNPNYRKGFLFNLHKLRNASINSLFCSFTAWSAGSGLNLMHRNLFIPGAIFANFIILPFVWILFLFASFDIILFPLRRILHIEVILELLLKLINGLSIAGADWGGAIYLAPPPYFLLVLFFICLIIISTTDRKAYFLAAAGVLILNVISWHINPFCEYEKKDLAVIHGNESQMPAFISILPGQIGANVVNAGSRKRAQAILDYLTGKGINSIENLCFSGSGRDTCDGAWILFSGLDVKHVILPDDYARSNYGKSVIESAIRSGAFIDLITGEKQSQQKKYKSPELSIISDKNHNFNFTEHYPGIICIGKVSKAETAEKEVVSEINGISHELQLMNSNRMKFFCY